MYVFIYSKTFRRTRCIIYASRVYDARGGPSSSSQSASGPASSSSPFTRIVTIR